MRKFFCNMGLVVFVKGKIVYIFIFLNFVSRGFILDIVIVVVVSVGNIDVYFMIF